MTLSFAPDKCQEIYNAIQIKVPEQNLNITVEVAQHLGNNTVRAVAMSSTDGLQRGVDAVDTGAPITVPVGPATLGRMVSVLGLPIDNAGEIDTDTHYSYSSACSGFLSIKNHLPGYWKLVLRLLTYWLLILRVGKLDYWAAPVLVKRYYYGINQ